MREVTYSMGVSLDGCIVGPDGDLDWKGPDAEAFRFVTDEIRGVGVYLLGRRLYETMLYWGTAGQDPSLGGPEREWAAIWNPFPKVVFSTRLSTVQGNARLAAEAAALDLIDDFGVRVYPVLVGGGIPFFPSRQAPGGSRTRRDPHLRLGSDLPPLPPGALTTRASDVGRPWGLVVPQAGPRAHATPLHFDTHAGSAVSRRASPCGAVRRLTGQRLEMSFRAGR